MHLRADLCSCPRPTKFWSHLINVGSGWHCFWCDELLHEFVEGFIFGIGPSHLLRLRWRGWTGLSFTVLVFATVSKLLAAGDGSWSAISNVAVPTVVMLLPAMLSTSGSSSGHHHFELSSHQARHHLEVSSTSLRTPTEWATHLSRWIPNVVEESAYSYLQEHRIFDTGIIKK